MSKGYQPGHLPVLQKKFDKHTRYSNYTSKRYNETISNEQKLHFVKREIEYRMGLKIRDNRDFRAKANLPEYLIDEFYAVWASEIGQFKPGKRLEVCNQVLK
jgi:hypothetical protein